MSIIKLIGDAPNQVSRNRDLGDLAYQDAENIAGDVGVGGNLSYTGTLTGGTGVINIGSGQVYKDASGNLLVGYTADQGSGKLQVNGAGRIGAIDFNTDDLTYVGGGTFTVGTVFGVPLAFKTSGTERARIDSSGHLIVPEGITLGTAAGTYNAANTLDDYEEGTWTGALVAGTSGTITMDPALQTGSYTKVGRLVTVTGLFYVDAVSSPVGSLTLTGLPYATPASNYSRTASAVFANNLQSTATSFIMGALTSSSGSIALSKLVAGVSTAMAADVKADSSFVINLSYVVE